jgi:hypothetical protein
MIIVFNESAYRTPSDALSSLGVQNRVMMMASLVVAFLASGDRAFIYKNKYGMVGECDGGTAKLIINQAMLVEQGIPYTNSRSPEGDGPLESREDHEEVRDRFEEI